MPIAKILDELSNQDIVEERYFLDGGRVGDCPCTESITTGGVFLHNILSRKQYFGALC